jgi:putative CRISPR-associated protein (TIGR02619 family)
MGRTLFLTVGTSAITNRELWEHRGDLPTHLPRGEDWGELIRATEANAIKDLSHHGRLRSKDWESVERRVRGENLQFEQSLTEHHREFWRKNNAHRRNSNHRRRTSAEAISTWLAGEKDLLDGGPLAGGDKVVLVVSRTCIGQMAGRINQAIFREFLFTGDSGQEVCIETVDDLRLEGVESEGGEVKSLSGQVRKIYEDHRDRRTPLFNITGGFKGLIPAITVIASTEGRTILYMHDSMSGAVRLRFEIGVVPKEIEDFHVV